jgi:MoxR-like ATPase
MAVLEGEQVEAGGESVDPRPVVALYEKVAENLRSVMHTSEETLHLALVCLLAEGHLLVEDMPGTGKTTMAKALGLSTQLSVARIQFTPDLSPADVVGRRIYMEREGKYELLPGPIFSNIVVADELNRASPRTQAALLESMQECQVTFGMVSVDLEKPFLVLATQNPIEQLGTFELPEAQLDRFMMKLSLGYPPPASERELILEQAGPDPLRELSPVADASDVRRAQADVRKVFAHERIADYIVALLQATRQDRSVELGASPRAGIALLRASKANALVSGRQYVRQEDVLRVALPVLSHRISLKGSSRGGVPEFLQRLLKDLPFSARPSD